MTRTLIMQSYSRSPKMYDGVFPYAVVELTPEYCKLVQDRIALIGEHPEVSLMVFPDTKVSYYNACPIRVDELDEDGQEVRKVLKEKHLVIVELEAIMLVGPPLNSFCNQMEVSQMSVHWRGYLKGASVTEETIRVPLRIFEEKNPHDSRARRASEDQLTAAMDAAEAAREAAKAAVDAKAAKDARSVMDAIREVAKATIRDASKAAAARKARDAAVDARDAARDAAMDAAVRKAREADEAWEAVRDAAVRQIVKDV